MWRDWNPCTSLVGMYNATVAMKTISEFRKIKLQLTCDSVILVLGIYYKQLKAGSQRDICILMFIAALSQYMEATQICINRQMDKQNVEYIHNVILFKLKKKRDKSVSYNTDEL